MKTKEEIIKEKLDYLKIVNKIQDSRYTSLYGFEFVQVGTRIMYDSMYGLILSVMQEYAAEQCKAYKEIVDQWELTYDFILKYIDFEKMSHDDNVKIWHLEHLQKITELKQLINDK